ncbi:S16 family serine protease [Streptomyces abyssomicinicus]|uniref:S16 family serine protease n=1 Tax=Streptomyces abyssomicinicus TaxID=574929 RepID=UPI00124F8299|nr:S16 family serine protease [Streptomyces abyssomicinicus]
MFSRLSRPKAAALCALPAVALIAVAALAPLPFTVARPGMTANVLGERDGKPVISIEGARTVPADGQLRMTTIEATGPDADVRLADVVDGWFRTDEAVMPTDAVYPSGDDVEEIERYNAEQMRQSQDDATEAALGYLRRSPEDVKVTLRLADVGGPSAGLLFSLGIVEKLGTDLAGDTVVAGTGTISPEGAVGTVGGVALKTRAAARDGATVFLVPRAECRDALTELPKGLRLVPVTTLRGAVTSLEALRTGKGDVPSC